MNLQLKRIRKERGLRQEDLAKAIFSTPRIVGAWERGETPISLEDACTLADYFDITLDELAGREWHDPSLSADESQLVDHYRSMTKRQRDGLMAFLPSVADGGLAKNDELSEEAV